MPDGRSLFGRITRVIAFKGRTIGGKASGGYFESPQHNVDSRMEESHADRQRQDEQQRVRISERLVQSGEKERLKELLRLKLVECGWRDEMKLHCKEVIRNKGIDQVTVEDLIEEITPKGRASVPADIKNELLDKIKAFIEKEMEADKTEEKAVTGDS